MEQKLTYKEQIKISILVILGFTIAMIGGAYAYFSASVTGDAVTNTVTAAQLASLRLVDDTERDNMVLDNIYPGWMGVQSLYLTNLDEMDARTYGEGAYEISITHNIPVAFDASLEDTTNSSWIKYKLYKTSDVDKVVSITKGTLENDNGNFVKIDTLNEVDATIELVSEGFIEPTGTSTTITAIDKENFEISSPDEYYVYYYLVVEFVSAGVDQNQAMGETFDITLDAGSITRFTQLRPTYMISGSEVGNLPTKESGMKFESSTCEGLTWNNETWSPEYTFEGVVDCEICFVNPPKLSETITKLVGKGQVFNENGIRYQGVDPNNYVVFKESDELYRIIGVFDTLLADGTTTESLVKIIKNESIGNLVWDAGNINDWNASDIKNTLNTNFLNSTGSYTANGLNDQKEMIADVTWNLGGAGDGLTADGFYNAERGTVVYSGRPTTGTGKVGLMYPSDYMYAVKETDCARTIIGTEYSLAANSSCRANNWLLPANTDWTITLKPVNYAHVWYLTKSAIGADGASATRGVSPSIYLNSDVSILSGTGSSIDPYVLG